MMDSKICSRCELEKQLDDFRTRTYKSGKLYKLTICKECEHNDCNAYYKQNRNERLEYAKQYRVSNSDKVHNATKKWRDNNKEHMSIYNEQYGKKHRKYLTERRKINSFKKPEQYKMYSTINTQRRRAYKNRVENNFNKNDWNACIAYFDNKCAYCGKEKKLTQDHFVALVHGGEHTRNNVVCACGFCNASKHKKNFFIWYPKQPFYSREREKNIMRYLDYNPQTKSQQLKLVI